MGGGVPSYSVNQEILGGCGWEGRGKRLGAGEGISVAGGADTKCPMYVYVCVYLHVYERAQLMLPHFSQL